MPVRFEVCGLLLALSLTLNCPVRVPVTLGVNVTLIVHLPLAARLAVQVVAETAKSPVVEITILSSSTVWLLVRVNVFAGRSCRPRARGTWHWPEPASQA